jgi:SCP-2 sterol transfer family
MSDPASAFFEDLARRGHDERLRRATGAIRFEGKNARAPAWQVDLNKGDIVVSQKRAAAECTIRADDEVTAGILSGRINPLTALLRGEIELDGNPRLLVLFRRLLPGPPTKRARRKR